LATPNYGYEKRQKELTKKKKKEEKLKHKAERKVGEGAEESAIPSHDDQNAAPGELVSGASVQP
jgi:hypothetical protein